MITQGDSLLPFHITTDLKTGLTDSVTLYGQQLLDGSKPVHSELAINGRQLAMRAHRDPHDGTRELNHLKGEHWVDHLTGWSLVLARRMGLRTNGKFPCFGIQSTVRRERCDHTQIDPGPGGPPIEAPLYIDTLSLLNWNWQFWGEDTRMIATSGHSNGPTEEYGHCGHENCHPTLAKFNLKNPYRRIYPGNLMVHGGLFYDIKSNNWLAMTCRRPNVGYQLNIDDAGLGVSYDFTLHAPFVMNEVLRLPEIKFYFGPDHESMMHWLADYVTHYYHQPPDWVFKTLFREGLAWDNQPTWAQQADAWEKQAEDGLFTGISYSLVTNRPVKSGTTPLSYEPDPNHGTTEEFKAMCHRMADRNIPMFTWMSHSGLTYRGSDEIDDDWFIRGIDGGISSAWGNVDQPELAHINLGHPGFIAYTRKWIRFYIGECRCKGIFLDCMAWAFPSDFAPRDFMRYPGDTNRMAVRFVQAVYDEIKACDPDAILLGEGWGSDLPVNVFSIHANPKREHNEDPHVGTRDFLLSLNCYTERKLCVDQGPRLFGSCGFVVSAKGPQWDQHNRMMVDLLATHGGPNAWQHLPGDLSILKREGESDLLVVPVDHNEMPREVVLPNVSQLTELITGNTINLEENQSFANVKPGIYSMDSASPTWACNSGKKRAKSSASSS
jgi:hypothetical protein